MQSFSLPCGAEVKGSEAGGNDERLDTTNASKAEWDQRRGKRKAPIPVLSGFDEPADSADSAHERSGISSKAGNVLHNGNWRPLTTPCRCPAPRRPVNWFSAKSLSARFLAGYTPRCRRGSRPSEYWCLCARFDNMVAGGCDLVIGDRFAGSRWGICSFPRSPPAPRRHLPALDLSSDQGRPVMARRSSGGVPGTPYEFLTSALSQLRRSSGDTIRNS